MNTPFTYIIGYKHYPDRLNNLKRVLEWINGFNNVDVLVIEQDKHSKISHLNLKCRHIFIKSDKEYNRSWAFNVGTKLAKSDIVIFSDSDLIMRPNELIESIKQLDKYDMVNPYRSVVDLNQNELNLNIEQVFNINRPGRGENDNQKINICGGMSIFRKSSINKIGGWNENFLGWGGEDDFLTLKVKNFLNFIEMPYRCYHLYHGRTNMNMNLYQKNLELLNHYTKMSKEDLIRSINIDAPKNGMLNKYE